MVGLTGKNILLISPESWDHIFVSKHHYAVHLGKKGNKVFFLNPPARDKLVKNTQFENVFTVYYRGFPRGLRFYPRFLKRTIIQRFFFRLQASCATRFDVVWSFDNSVFFDFSCLPSSVLKISHIVDLNQDFQTRQAATTADYCFCTTEIIKKKLLAYNLNTYKINHGFCISPESTKGQEVQLRGERLRVAYAGNLSIACIDWPLILTVVNNHPEIDFHFIGPNQNELSEDVVMREAKKKVIESRNVFFVGRVDAKNLQQHYQYAEVLLVAYREEDQDSQANPHKIMEYLGSGKVVVATHTSEYMSLYPLVVMSNKNSHWPSLFDQVIGNLACYNSADLQTRRRAFAVDNSYDQQICRIEKIICSNSGDKESGSF